MYIYLLYPLVHIMIVQIYFYQSWESSSSFAITIPGSDSNFIHKSPSPVQIMIREPLVLGMISRSQALPEAISDLVMPLFLKCAHLRPIIPQSQGSVIVLSPFEMEMLLKS